MRVLVLHSRSGRQACLPLRRPSPRQFRLVLTRLAIDNVAKYMDSPEVEQFAADKNAAKEHVRKYGTGTEDGNAPKQDFTSK